MCMNKFEYLNMFVTLFDTTQATLGSGIGDPGKARLMLAFEIFQQDKKGNTLRLKCPFR